MPALTLLSLPLSPLTVALDFLLFIFKRNCPDQLSTLSYWSLHSNQRYLIQIYGCAFPYADLTSHSARSEEHTFELQSRPHLVCRLLLEKKKKIRTAQHPPLRNPSSCGSGHRLRHTPRPPRPTPSPVPPHPRLLQDHPLLPFTRLHHDRD